MDPPLPPPAMELPHVSESSAEYPIDCFGNDVTTAPDPAPNPVDPNVVNVPASAPLTRPATFMEQRSINRSTWKEADKKAKAEGKGKRERRSEGKKAMLKLRQERMFGSMPAAIEMPEVCPSCLPSVDGLEGFENEIDMMLRISRRMAKSILREPTGRHYSRRRRGKRKRRRPRRKRGGKPELLPTRELSLFFFLFTLKTIAICHSAGRRPRATRMLLGFAMMIQQRTVVVNDMNC